MLRIVLAGSVGSSFVTLKKLVEHELSVIAVFGLEPKDESKVSGYVNMKEYCDKHGIAYYPFAKISSESIKEVLLKLEPDIFFVIGLSQLIPTELLQIPKIGNIGFHPTLLPKGRGRAPIAWLILEEKHGAANFFLMGNGVDDGPVFVQKEFEVENNDTAMTIERKILENTEKALDEWLPELKKGKWNPISQQEMNASWYGKRAPEDGWIDWEKPADYIHKLIRASSPPHPGAYSFLGNQKVLVYHSVLEVEMKIKGVIGRVLIERDQSCLIQTGAGLLWISEVFNENKERAFLKVGQKLGYYTELEIYKINKEIQKLKETLGI
jgi:methionyl-tRNA formyltransferase